MAFRYQDHGKGRGFGLWLYAGRSKLLGLVLSRSRVGFMLTLQLGAGAGYGWPLGPRFMVRGYDLFLGRNVTGGHHGPRALALGFTGNGNARGYPKDW